MKNTLNKKGIERYSRQIILKDVGPIGQKKIMNSKVLVVGAGGLGCPVIDYLSRAGVGNIGIIDNEGNLVFPDQLMALMLPEILKKGDNIVFDVKCSKTLEDEILRLGGIEITRIKKILRSNIKYGLKKKNLVIV